jgi:predicted nucleotidyltransferase
MGMSSLTEIAACHRVRLLLQHGSTVSGRIHARSDLDIAALFEDGPPSLSRVVALGTDLQGHPRKLFEAVCEATHELPDHLRHVDAWLAP